MKFTKAALITLSLSLFLVGCKCDNKERRKGALSHSNQEITINIVSDPSVLDPRQVRSLTSVNLVKTFMEGLMRINKDGVTSPALADSFKLSGDNKIYEFHLRESSWSNGDPVTAHDFIYAWKKALSPDFPADNAFLLYAIKNAKFVKDGSLPASMLGIQAKDDHTLLIELERPVPYFLEMLALPSFFPVNSHVDRENPNWYLSADTFVCNGPFKMGSWEHNNAIVAKKNDLYWDAKTVKLDSIQMLMVSEETGFNMFQNGELDWDGSPYSTISSDAITMLKEKNLVQTDPFLGTYWIRTNTSIFPLNSSHMRRALALAIDRNEIIDHVLQGGQTPAYSIVPASLGLQTTSYFGENDQDRAISCLKVALEEEGNSIEKLPELTLTYPASTNSHRIAQVVQQHWQTKLGLKVRLEPVEAKVYFDRISKGDFQLACGSWIADFRDPVSFLEVFKTKNIGTNNTNWESPHYLKAIEQSYVATCNEDRTKALRQSEEILLEELPVIPVYHYSLIHVKNDHLKDVVLTDSGHLDFKWAYVE